MNRLSFFRGLMAYDPKVHHRQSTRLRNWDYAWPWWYFVTIVAHNRQCVFGNVQNDHLVPSELGKIADAFWRQIPQHHPGVGLDDHVVMPNHVHGIIIINDMTDAIRGDVQLNVPTKEQPIFFSSKREAMGALSPRKNSLSVIVRTYKAAVTTWARNNGVGDFGWQGCFHDHIIRNDADLQRIREYIRDNPLRWAIDQQNRGNDPGRRSNSARQTSRTQMYIRQCESD